MKSRRKTTVAAYALIEMLVYISLLALLTGLGYAAAYRCMNHSTALRRSLEDITNAVRAGEKWRQDFRAAGTQVRVETNAAEQILRLAGPGKPVAYRFSENTISRRVGNSEWSTVLARVKSSAFIPDPRPNASAWRWEVELQPRTKRFGQIPPLFTFFAVPAKSQ
jgi:type II secretory pathway component PulJ